MTYYIEQAAAESSWWAIQNEVGEKVGIMVVYVDDIRMCSDIAIVKALAMAITTLWKTTELAMVVQGCPLRFLGMEIDIDEGGTCWISQLGYIKEILRTREISARSLDKVPICTELTIIEAEPEEDITQEIIRDAQGPTGEILWVSQRARPDLSYATSIVPMLTLKAPNRTIRLCLRI